MRCTRQSVFIILLTSWGSAALAEPPTAEEMWEIIQQQQQMIEELKSRLEATDQKTAEHEQQLEKAHEEIEATAVALEEVHSETAGAGILGDKTSIGGYGELHYNNTDTKKEIDFHRFVLYFGHEFTDGIRFFSEFELEHALTGDDAEGELELEQAWIEMDLNENHALRAGVDILPIGIINPTHEPQTFFGVERNPVEVNIIPSTWWEAGLGLNGQIAPGWSYDAIVHSGLETPVSGSNAFLIRSGRNKVSEASARDGAFTGRLRYSGIPGLEVAVSGQYQQDVTQSDKNIGDIAATLFEGHVDYRHAATGLGLRALYARWDLDEGPAGTGPQATGRDEQYGYYVEPSWSFAVPGNVRGQLGMYGRYSYWDNNAGNSLETESDQIEAGINYWPIENVVFKFDVFSQGKAAEDSGFNLGLGYEF